MLCPMDFYCAAVETYLSPLESCADGRKTINQTLNYINQGLNYINQTLNYINQSLVYRLSLEKKTFSPFPSTWGVLPVKEKERRHRFKNKGKNRFSSQKARSNKDKFLFLLLQ